MNQFSGSSKRTWWPSGERDSIANYRTRAWSLAARALCGVVLVTVTSSPHWTRSSLLSGQGTQSFSMGSCARKDEKLEES